MVVLSFICNCEIQLLFSRFQSLLNVHYFVCEYAIQFSKDKPQKTSVSSQKNTYSVLTSEMIVVLLTLFVCHSFAAYEVHPSQFIIIT